MKAVNKISQVLAVLFSAAAVILFFLPFATVAFGGKDYTFIGAQFAFGTGIEGIKDSLAKSGQVLFCFILALLTLVFSGLTFKFKKMRYWAPGVGLAGAVFMLVRVLRGAGHFIDHRPLEPAKISYEPFVWLTVAALFAAVVFGICHLFIDDRIMVSEGKAKRTIIQRIIHALRDYKSEIKKIVWPGPRDVVKNTLVVIAVCVLVGIFIWLVDFGLSWLIRLVTGA